MKNHVFMLGWRPLGSRKRRWQVRDCDDLDEAARLAAGLVRLDGGGRWRVYGMVSVPARAGSVKLECGQLLAEGLERLSVAPDARCRTSST